MCARECSRSAASTIVLSSLARTLRASSREQEPTRKNLKLATQFIVTWPLRAAVVMPKNINFIEAAAVPLAGTTAWQALIDTAKLGKDQTVLIHGGSGGVGSFAIPIAKARGAKVIATASTAHQALLRQLGVDLAIDYTTTRFEDAVKDVDLVLNCARADALGRSYGVLKKGGMIVSITDEPDQTECAKHDISCSRMGAHPEAKVLEELTKLIEARKMTPTASQTFPLAEASQAHQQIETRHTLGKIVLKVAEAP